MDQLQKYEVHPGVAFVPNEEPLERLPEQFNAWEETIENIVSLIKKKELQDKVKSWSPVILSDANLPTLRHWQRAYVVLTFVGQGYIWMNGPDNPTKEVPSVLAKPWFDAATHLGLHPVVTYAAVVLYNWKLEDPSKGVKPQNVRTRYTFTGTDDESEFYRLSLLCELAGADGVIAAMQLLSDDKVEKKILMLRISSSIKNVVQAMKVMHTNINPAVFYKDIRPFFNGWNDVYFKGIAQGQKALSFIGASAAESSLVPVFDILLEVKHADKGFFNNQRKYMPKVHQDFLIYLEGQAKHCSLAMKVAMDHELIQIYNECVEELVHFRKEHWELIKVMIIEPSGGADTQGSAGTKLSFLPTFEEDTKKSKIKS